MSESERHMMEGRSLASSTDRHLHRWRGLLLLPTTVCIARVIAFDRKITNHAHHRHWRRLDHVDC